MKTIFVVFICGCLALFPAMGLAKGVDITGDYRGESIASNGAKGTVEARLIQDGAKVNGDLKVINEFSERDKLTRHYEFEKGSLVGNKLKLSGKSGKSIVIKDTKSMTFAPSNIPNELEGVVSTSSISGSLKEASGGHLFDFKLKKLP
jgi:hypothetical protein